MHLKIVLILTVGLALASLFGYLSYRAKLSPILGYLLAGYAIGPYSPGFVADLALSEQLAEIGVVLMMFIVGLQFKAKDLLNVKHVAIPGALVQTLIAAAVSAGLVYAAGWTIEAGTVLGLALGVASTVVLVRLLNDNHLSSTRSGHIAIGWLIVEDAITIVALLTLPVLAHSLQANQFDLTDFAYTLMVCLLKFLALLALMATLGRRAIQFALRRVIITKSNELLTITILALTFLVATASAFVFGTSIALGAFLAGMIIGQTDFKHRVSLTFIPLRDTFAAIFFLSIGMLFNPVTIRDHYLLFIAVMGVIFLIKPLAAFLIVTLLKQPLETKLIVPIALAQIGEFSFILAEEASKLKILPDSGYDVIIAAAFFSIAFNPIIFRLFSKNLAYKQAYGRS
ncbi:MAG: cation:proton antiporter [Myxococcota bacterium]